MVWQKVGEVSRDLFFKMKQRSASAVARSWARGGGWKPRPQRQGAKAGAVVRWCSMEPNWKAGGRKEEGEQY